jgi:hypothetical protein
MQDPSMQAYDAGIGVLAYLHTTRNLGLTYGPTHKQCPLPAAQSSEVPIGHFDSSFGRTPYPFGGGFIEWRGAGVTWFARKPKTPPDSSAMGELAVTVEGSKAMIFTANVVEDMVGTIGVPHMLNDNKAAIDMIHKPGVTKKSVHYERWIHFARELHLSGRMKYFWCSTVQMMADGFTKVVDKATFLKGRAYYMNIETAS